MNASIPLKTRTQTEEILLNYRENLNSLREREYPMLHGSIYLDHAGTTLYPKSLIDDFSQEMMSNVLGNPHSFSEVSQRSTRRIDDIRLRALRFFNASPDDFDLIFVANATAGIKLVVDGFREHEGGFWYGYHKDAHTSVVGVREVATPGHHCFESDSEVDEWLQDSRTLDAQSTNASLGLFAYPAQSNLNGRRLPLSWSGRIRSSNNCRLDRMYSLLDAAALVSTSPLDLSNVSLAPDYTVLSFYKIFGFPDLGAVIVRKESARPLQRRKYFGGGTVEMVTCIKEHWHVKKESSLHEQLEDGTLPIHSIIALGSALSAHERLYGSMERVSIHTSFLAKEMYNRLSLLRHGSGRAVCHIYKDSSSTYSDSRTQGPVIALSLRNSAGEWISNSEIEKLAFVKNIQFRSGGLCNPGGIASSLGLAPWEMRRNFSAGQRCGNDIDVIGGKPTGVIRLSLGAMSNLQDIEALVQFFQEFFVNNQKKVSQGIEVSSLPGHFYIEKLAIYPIKSCGAWPIPSKVLWDVRAEGLAWDREWCLIHQGTGAVLSQKIYPKMALIKPVIDLQNGLLRIRYNGQSAPSIPSGINIPLSGDPTQFGIQEDISTIRVCNDTLKTYTYASKDVATFFTAAIGTPCTLARFPPNNSGPLSRHSKAHLQPHQTTNPSAKTHSIPGAFPVHPTAPRPILFSNESPILTISRSSLNRLNEHIKSNPTGKATHASAFRANIIVAEDPASPPGAEQPYAEDIWRFMRVIHNSDDPTDGTRTVDFEFLGACRRCHMVCVDQRTGERGEEPLVTLAKTRRFAGKIFFGVHTALLNRELGARIAVGDVIVPVREGEEEKMGFSVGVDGL